jgi:hypothetical protein
MHTHSSPKRSCEREQVEECMEYIQQHIANVTMACEFRGSSTTPTWRQQTLSPY